MTSTKKENANKYIQNGYNVLNTENYISTIRALTLFNKAKKRLSKNDSNMPLVINGINYCNFRKHKYKTIQRDYDKYLEKNPGNITLLLAYASILEQLCDITNAVRIYKMVNKLTNGTINNVLINCIRYDKDIDDLQFIENADITDKSSLYYMKALLYNRKDDVKREWINYYKYNTTLYNLPFSKMMLDNYRKAFKKLRSLNKEDTFPKKVIDNEYTLVFIVGFNKSGLNLVNKLLNEHSEIYPIGKVLPDFSKIKIDNDKDKEVQSKEVQSKEAQSNDDDDTMYYKLFEEMYYDILSIYKDSEQLGKNGKYFTICCSEMYMYMGIIVKLFKNVKIIQCERDFMDVGTSLYTGNYTSQNMNWTTDMNEIINFHKFYTDNINHWELSTNDKIVIQYNDLVNNLNDEMYKVFEFLKLPNIDCSLSHISHIKVETEDSSLLSKKVYSDSIGKWKRYDKYLSEFKSYYKK